MLMAQAAPIKFGEMRNVFKCKYVHSAQKKKKKRVKCIHERRRMREGGNPRHSCEQRRNEAAVGKKRWMVCEALLLDQVLLSEPGANQARFNYSSLWLPHFTLSEPDST